MHDTYVPQLHIFQCACYSCTYPTYMPQLHISYKTENQAKRFLTGRCLKRSVAEVLLQSETDPRRRGCLLPVQHWSPQTCSCSTRCLNASRFPLGGHLPFGLLEGLKAEERAEQDSLRVSGSCGQARRPSCRCHPALCSQPHRAIPQSLLPFQKQEVISWSPSPDGGRDFPHAHGKSFGSFLSGNLTTEWPDLFGQCP